MASCFAAVRLIRSDSSWGKEDPMSKFYVQSVVEWLLGRPTLMTSVEGEDGQPIDGLDESNFHVHTIGSGGGWNECPMSGLRTEGESHGFYQLFIDPPFFGEQQFPWAPNLADLVFTVEVERARDRGQALAINKCCGDDGMGRR